jgi:Uri superfamily endonuclease
MSSAALPAGPGSYLLVLRAERAVDVTVGALGMLRVLPGYYLYTGSAFGPGGLRARVGRHVGPPGALRWHIDYLRRAAQPAAVWCAPGPARWEHAWARALSASPACRLPLARFGASDCQCAAHLFFMDAAPDDAFLAALGILAARA